MDSSFSSQKNLFSIRKTHFCIWFFIACVVSLLIHFFVFKKIEHLEIASFNPATFDVIIPRKFHLERVKIDPKLLEEPENKKENALIQPVDLSFEEKKDFSTASSLQNNSVKPQLLDNNQLSSDKPAALLENQILPQTTQSFTQSAIAVDSAAKESTLESLKNNTSSSVSAYSDLDQLIEKNVPISAQTAPILLPTDLLFEYDADQLKANAEESLKKLALLIQRNPRAQFIVEGFTDSFGSDAYNLDLSTRRANSIKQWLLQKERINPDQIQSYGLGKTHFIVPSTGTIEQQNLNRRVEVIIRQAP